LPGLLEAQIAGQAIVNPRHSIAIFRLIKDLPGLRFTPPNGYFEFNGLSDTNKDVVIRSGLVEEPSRPNTFTGCPSFELFADVYSMEPFSSRIPPGYSSVEAVAAYIFMIKGMALFSTVTHGMAYSTAPLMISNPKHVIKDKGEIAVECGTSTTTSKVSFDSAGWTIMDNVKVLPICAPTDITRTFHRGYTTSQSPKLQSVHQGGRFFPYIEGTQLPDKNFAYSIFADIFFNCLQDDLSEAPDLLNMIRKGYKNLANKEAGMAISHAYAGIKLAKQGHCNLTFIISHGQYQGFVLEGDFKVCIYGKEYEGELIADVMTRIGNVNKHDAALVMIASHIERLKNADGMPKYPTKADDLNTSRKLLRRYKSLILADFAAINDFHKDLRKLIGDLNFEDKYAPFTVSSINTFLRYVSTGNESLLDNEPAWLEGGYVEKCGSIVATGLGMFGNVAPSLSYGGTKDQVFSMPASTTATDPNLQLKADGKRPLQYLPVKKVQIDLALAQWTKLFETGKFIIPVGRKGKEEFTDSRQVFLKITGEPAFSQNYRLIKEHSIAVRDMGRKRGPDREDVGGSKKRRVEVSKSNRKGF